MPTPFHLELMTPERVLFSGEVEEISMRTDGGEIAFLAHHEDFIGAVAITVVRLSVVSGESAAGSEGPEMLLVAVHGGFVHVEQGQVTILAGVAELGNEIDVERARRALAEAEERLATEGPARRPLNDGAEQEGPTESLTGAMVALLAPDSAEAAVERAKVRLEAAGAAAGS